MTTASKHSSKHQKPLNLTSVPPTLNAPTCTNTHTLDPTVCHNAHTRANNPLTSTNGRGGSKVELATRAPRHALIFLSRSKKRLVLQIRPEGQSQQMTQQTPKGLARAGKALWREVQRQYVLDPAEASILMQMCRISDQLSRISDQLWAENVVVSGSRGQDVANPLLAESRLLSAALARLAKSLNLPQPRSGSSSRKGRLTSVEGLRKSGA